MPSTTTTSTLPRPTPAPQLTTANIGDQRDVTVWQAYKSRFNKTYDIDEDRIRRTLFVRRLEYFKHLVAYCKRDPIELDRRLDTVLYPIEEDEKRLIMQDRDRQYPIWSPATWLNDLHDWQIELYTIFYFHRRALMDCANYQYNYRRAVEQLLF